MLLVSFSIMLMHLNAFTMDNLFVAFDDINAIDFLSSNYSTFKVVVAPSAIKYPGNPVLIADKPWEKTLDNGYINIVYDPTNTPPWQLWYAAFIYYPDWKGINNSATLYATSNDGIHWNKPELNLYPINGSTANNAVCVACHGWGVWKEADPNDHGIYYKAFGGYGYQNGINCDMKEDDNCTVIATSKDGIIWNETDMIRPNINNRWDTHNIMFR